MRLPNPALYAVLGLAACGSVVDDLPSVEGDATMVASTLEASQPADFIELVDDPATLFQLDRSCLVTTQGGAAPAASPPAHLGPEPGPPFIDEATPSAQSDHVVDDEEVVEVWRGPCTTADGAQVEGELKYGHGPDGDWVAAEAFSIRRDGVLDVYLDGAIEVEEQGSLLLVDAAAALCGGLSAPCSTGATRVDLAFTLYPAAGYPHAFDATVSGAVAAGEGLVNVEGAWSVDEASCDDEPSNGTFALDGAARYTVELDGASSCDGCVGWTVQGHALPPVCDVDL